jgi:hypothetical protein
MFSVQIPALVRFTMYSGRRKRRRRRRVRVQFSVMAAAAGSEHDWMPVFCH